MYTPFSTCDTNFCSRSNNHPARATKSVSRKTRVLPSKSPAPVTKGVVTVAVAVAVIIVVWAWRSLAAAWKTGLLI